MDEVAAMVPEAAEYVTALDMFVESIAFGLDHLDRMGELAAANHLSLRAHVEQSRPCAPSRSPSHTTPAR
jgi:hypothetical protein